VTNKSNQTSHFVHDAFGNTTQTSVPSNGTTFDIVYGYNYSVFPIGQLASIQPDGKTPTVFSYYPTGQLQTILTPRPGTSNTGDQVSTTYTYSALGNILTIAVPPPNNSGGPNVIYSYNYTSDPYIYDPISSQPEALGEPLTLTDPLGHVTHF